MEYLFNIDIGLAQESRGDMAGLLNAVLVLYGELRRMATRLMRTELRRILVDHVLRGWRLRETATGSSCLLAIWTDPLMEREARSLDAPAAKVMELRYFGGLSEEELTCQVM